MADLEGEGRERGEKRRGNGESEVEREEKREEV